MNRLGDWGARMLDRPVPMTALCIVGGVLLGVVVASVIVHLF
jgi:hypothetical protein